MITILTAAAILLTSGSLTVAGIFGDIVSLATPPLAAAGEAYTDLYPACELGCVPGNRLRLNYGGGYDCLDLRVGRTVYPSGELFTMLAASGSLVLPALEVGPHTATSPMVLTVVTPEGVVYTGSGTATVWLWPDLDLGVWQATKVVYAISAPPPPRKPKH